MNTRYWPAVMNVMLVTWLVQAPGVGRAQDRTPLTKDEAVLVVDGVVREVFQSAKPDRLDYVVQLEVKKSEYGRTPRTPVRVVMPAPGDLLYVHTSDRAGDARRALPVEGSPVRTYVVPGAGGGWDGAGRDWFDQIGNGRADAGNPGPAGGQTPAPANPRPSSPTAAAPATKSALVALGLTGEALSVKGQFVLRVTSVEQGGAAQRAGLQPGDVVIGANDKRIDSLDQLDQLARQGGALSLVVLDVNTGKAVRVPVELAAMDPAGAGGALPQPNANERPAAPAAPAPAPAGKKRPLGIAAQPVQLGQRTAMKVITVAPGSPAQEAGIEPGDVLVAANGVAVTGPEALSAVIRKTGASLTLTVRDTRSGRDVPVEVKLGGNDPAPPASIPTDPQIASTSGPRKLGAVTELVFYDIDPAVKVTEVEPGSPADRANLKVGDIIVAANGTPVLHPNTLTEIVSKSGSTLKLSVIDSASGRKTSVDVSLGNR